MMVRLASIVLLSACSGGNAPEPSESDADVSAFSAALLDDSWPVRMVEPATRSPFESNPGWGAYFERDLSRALSSLGDDTAGIARMHTEYAAMYRQALLMYAHATHHVYGERLRETDPKESLYFHGVSQWILDDANTARTDFDAVPADSDSTVMARVEAWKGMVDQPWPPAMDAGVFPVGLPDVAVGDNPTLDGLPHYQLAEQSADALLIDNADPLSLLSLSVWHENAAKAAADNDALVDAVLNGWRVPVEDVASVNIDAASDSWLFMSPYLSVADINFVSSAVSDGVGAVEAHAQTSLLAATIAPAIVEGQVVPQQVLDQAALLKGALKERMKEKAGLVENFHQNFAAMAEISVLRAAMVVADANDQYRDAGILRLNALDMSEGSAWDPVFVLSVATWSTGNQNTVRAEELVHKLITRYPAVEAARYPLDALHIRRSRDTMQLAPVH